MTLKVLVTYGDRSDELIVSDDSVFVPNTSYLEPEVLPIIAADVRLKAGRRSAQSGTVCWKPGNATTTVRIPWKIKN